MWPWIFAIEPAQKMNRIVKHIKSHHSRANFPHCNECTSSLKVANVGYKKPKLLEQECNKSKLNLGLIIYKNCLQHRVDNSPWDDVIYSLKELLACTAIFELYNYRLK